MWTINVFAATVLLAAAVGLMSGIALSYWVYRFGGDRKPPRIARALAVLTLAATGVIIALFAVAFIFPPSPVS